MIWEKTRPNSQESPYHLQVGQFPLWNKTQWFVYIKFTDQKDEALGHRAAGSFLFLKGNRLLSVYQTSCKSSIDVESSSQRKIKYFTNLKDFLRSDSPICLNVLSEMTVQIVPMKHSHEKPSWQSEQECFTAQQNEELKFVLSTAYSNPINQLYWGLISIIMMKIIFVGIFFLLQSST